VLSGSGEADCAEAEPARKVTVHASATDRLAIARRNDVRVVRVKPERRIERTDVAIVTNATGALLEFGELSPEGEGLLVALPQR